MLLLICSLFQKYIDLGKKAKFNATSLSECFIRRFCNKLSYTQHIPSKAENTSESKEDNKLSDFQNEKW